MHDGNSHGATCGWLEHVPIVFHVLSTCEGQGSHGVVQYRKLVAALFQFVPFVMKHRIFYSLPLLQKFENTDFF